MVCYPVPRRTLDMTAASSYQRVFGGESVRRGLRIGEGVDTVPGRGSFEEDLAAAEMVGSNVLPVEVRDGQVNVSGLRSFVDVSEGEAQ